EINHRVHGGSFPFLDIGFHKNSVLVSTTIRPLWVRHPVNLSYLRLARLESYHQDSMPLESLLLSRDPEVIRVLQPALEKLSIDVEVCRGVSSGQEILRTEKFDAIIVDCDDLKGALSVLGGLRKSASNKNSVTFAILNGSTTTQQAFQMGANFVLQKPI